MPSCFAYGDKDMLDLVRGASVRTYGDMVAALDQWMEMDSLPAAGRYGNSVVVVDQFCLFYRRLLCFYGRRYK
jgi:hypothetical protein